LLSVEVINLEETIEVLRDVDAGMASRLKREIKEIAKPTLEKAKGYARGVGSRPTGSYASSLSLATRANGVVFKSTDPGGGVIEFAHVGATILTGRRRGRTAPVPHTPGPPRALLRAILDDEGSIIQQLNEAVSSYVDEVVNVG
jgi:hypothetical protein